MWFVACLPTTVRCLVTVLTLMSTVTEATCMRSFPHSALCRSSSYHKTLQLIYTHTHQWCVCVCVCVCVLTGYKDLLCLLFSMVEMLFAISGTSHHQSSTVFFTDHPQTSMSTPCNPSSQKVTSLSKHTSFFQFLNTEWQESTPATGENFSSDMRKLVSGDPIFPNTSTR